MEDVPSKWICLRVEYGESRKHLYAHQDGPSLHPTEQEARKEAEGICSDDIKAVAVVARVAYMIKTRPLEFDVIVPATTDDPLTAPTSTASTTIK